MFLTGRGKGHFLGIITLSISSLAFGNAILFEYQSDRENKRAAMMPRSAMGSKWQIIKRIAQSLPDPKKLKLINDYINQDSALAADFYLKEIGRNTIDSFQFSAIDSVDCKCYAVAKYLALLEVGVPKEKMRITYVKASGVNRPHIVLTYFSSSQSSPLVLDNLISEIKRASLRKDLLPIYSFKGLGVWHQAKKSFGNNRHFDS